MKKIKGSCFCGLVEFIIKDDFHYAGYCHCSGCRKTSGACGVAVGAISPENFSITKGEKHIRKYKRSESAIANFCDNCGSRLYGEKPDTKFIHIRYGSLNDKPTLLPQAHIFAGSKADWYEITDTLPQFEGFPV
jgi:hypothetical protein